MSGSRSGDDPTFSPKVDRRHRLYCVSGTEVVAVEINDGDPSTDRAGVTGLMLCLDVFHSYVDH